MVRGRQLDPNIRGRIFELRAQGFGAKKIHKMLPDVPFNTIKTTLRRSKNGTPSSSAHASRLHGSDESASPSPALDSAAPAHHHHHRDLNPVDGAHPSLGVGAPNGLTGNPLAGATSNPLAAAGVAGGPRSVNLPSQAQQQQHQQQHQHQQHQHQQQQHQQQAKQQQQNQHHHSQQQSQQQQQQPSQSHHVSHQAHQPPLPRGSASNGPNPITSSAQQPLPDPSSRARSTRDLLDLLPAATAAGLNGTSSNTNGTNANGGGNSNQNNLATGLDLERLKGEYRAMDDARRAAAEAELDLRKAALVSAKWEVQRDLEAARRQAQLEQLQALQQEGMDPETFYARFRELVPPS